MNTLPEVLAIEHVATMLECEPGTVETALRNRQLPGIKYGRSWVLPRDALLAELNRQAMENMQAPSAPAHAAVLQAQTGRRTRSRPTLPNLNGLNF